MVNFIQSKPFGFDLGVRAYSGQGLIGKGIYDLLADIGSAAKIVNWRYKAGGTREQIKAFLEKKAMVEMFGTLFDKLGRAELGENGGKWGVFDTMQKEMSGSLLDGDVNKFADQLKLFKQALINWDEDAYRDGKRGDWTHQDLKELNIKLDKISAGLKDNVLIDLVKAKLKANCSKIDIQLSGNVLGIILDSVEEEHAKKRVELLRVFYLYIIGDNEISNRTVEFFNDFVITMREKGKDVYEHILERAAASDPVTSVQEFENERTLFIGFEKSFASFSLKDFRMISASMIQGGK